jgi:signal transduction histidine kinase
MQIRAKLSLQFIFVVTLIIIFGFGVIYYSSASYRENEFYQRLEKKAHTNAEIFLSMASVDSTMLRMLDRRQKDKLPLENITIFNAENKNIYTNNDSIVFTPTAALFDEVRTKGRKEFTVKDFQVLGLPYDDGHATYVVFAAAVDKYGLSKLNNLRVTMILMFILIISIVAFTGWLYAGRALKPLSQVINEVEKINVERLDTRLNKSPSRDEIGRLIDTFNILLERVENSIKLQKLFVSGASHELKNPLTTITSQLQVVLLNERSNDEYKNIIQSILEDIRKLNRTTLDLIEYARLNYEDEILFSPVRIDDVIWACRDYFSSHNPSCKVHLIFENMPADEKNLIVMGNEALLKVACINLIDNACKFSENKTCQITLSFQNDEIRLSFADNGIGLNEEEIKLIFEPFYRTNNTAEFKGHGIGLALTKKIMQLHHAKINVQSQIEHGAVFTLTFTPATL